MRLVIGSWIQAAQDTVDEHLRAGRNNSLATRSLAAAEKALSALPVPPYVARGLEVRQLRKDADQAQRNVHAAIDKVQADELVAKSRYLSAKASALESGRPPPEDPTEAQANG